MNLESSEASTHNLQVAGSDVIGIIIHHQARFGYMWTVLQMDKGVSTDNMLFIFPEVDVTSRLTWEFQKTHRWHPKDHED